MELRTEAIVLSTIKHKDNAEIVNFYTRKAGRLALLLYGAQSKRKGNAAAFLHPLSVVTIRADLRNSRRLNTIDEIKPLQTSAGILFNPVKSAISFFIAEVLQQVLHTNEQDEAMFNFIRSAISLLDTAERGLGNFHILFLVRLTHFLGLQPDLPTPTTNLYFDMQQVEYATTRPLHNHYLPAADTRQLQKLLRISPYNYPLFRFTRQERNDVVDRLLDYYRIHTTNFGDIKSLEVLREVFG